MADGLLGIDLGTSAVKALVVDEGGRTLGRGSAGYPTHHPQPGWAEQDPTDWWQATVQAAQQALAEAGSIRVTAIGLSGQMHGTVPLDAHGQALAPAVIWSDTRSGRQVAEITSLIGKEQLITIAGSPVATGFQAATVRWLQMERPVLWARVHMILLPKDYLRWRLTGVFATEPSDASSTLLLNVHRRDWADEILIALGISRQQLPPIQPSASVAGELVPPAAEAMGLPAGIPVVAGGGDAPLAALAAGAVDPTTLLLTISTGSQVIVPSFEVRVDQQGRIHTWCSCLEPAADAAGWYQMGATMVSGLALRWLRDQIFGLPPESAYERMAAWAAEAPPGAGGLLFLPYLTGERTPHMDPHARGLFLGLTDQHDRGYLVRAAMEGATLALFDAYEIVASLGARPTRIVLAGGGARSPLWRQIVADVFGMRVDPLANVEGSALGAALAAGAGAGRFNLASTARAWATYDEPVEPAAAAYAVYQRLLPIFRDSYVKHREDFEMLAGIGQP